MYIADMHCDTLTHMNENSGLINHYNTSNKYPQLQFFAAFVPFLGRSQSERRARVMSLANAYLYETDRLELVRITTAKDIFFAQDSGRSSALFSIEGGGGLLADSDELFLLYKLGLRIMGFCWDSNELCSSSKDYRDTGLTTEGVRMARRLLELGITPDVSHMSDRSFFDLCEVYRNPIIATHSNFRNITNHKRNLTPTMAREIARRGGVIGLNLYPEFLSTKAEATADDLLRHLDWGLEQIGEDHIAFGFDIDGTGGKYPRGFLENDSFHDRICELLLKRYPEQTVAKIAGENVINFLKGTMD